MPDTDKRLVFDMGADTKSFEAELAKTIGKLNELERKSSSVLSKPIDGAMQDIKRVDTQIEKLNDGITRTVQTLSKLEKVGDKIDWVPKEKVETTTAKLTEQEKVLERIVKQYKDLTVGQRNSKTALDQYITSLRQVASMEGYQDSAATAKAKGMIEAELNRAANAAYKEITALERERVGLQQKISEHGGHLKGIYTQQLAVLVKQIDSKQQIVDYCGRERVAEDLIYQRRKQAKELQAQQWTSQIKANQNLAANVQLRKTEYGYIAEVLNSEKQVLRVLNEQYGVRMKNSIAAQQLAKNLSAENAKHINNGTAMGKFMNSAIYSASGMAQYQVYNLMTEGFEAIKEYEKGIVDLRRTIQGVTEEELTNFGKTSIKYAKEFGIELKEVQDAMTELARAGVDETETLKEMTEVVAIGLNTTEIETAAEMTGYLVSTVKQLGMDMNDSMEIIDTWNYLADQYAVHTDDFALAIQRAGSASKNLGLDLYDVNALVTILGEATQASGQNIGTALRSMEVRLLRPDTIKTLESYGITVKKNEKEFLSFQEIMSNVNDVIEDMEENSVDLNNIMDALGGSWRKNWVTTLANDWERFDELVKEQQNNIGYSVAENEKAMDTLEKKIIQMQQAWIEFVITSSEESGLTEHLKSFFDGASGVIKAMNDADVGVWVVRFAEAAAMVTSIKLAITGINKIIGSDLPNSASALIKAFSSSRDNDFLNFITGATDKEAVGNSLAKSFAEAKDESGKLKYSLEEQLIAAQQIDKQFNTNTSDIIRQRLEVKNLEESLKTIDNALRTQKADVANQGDDYMKDRTKLMQERTAVINELAIKQNELNISEKTYAASMKNSNEIRAQVTAANLRMMASQLALNAAFTIGATIIMSVLFNAYDAVINRQQNMIDAAEEATDAFSGMTEKYQNSIETVSSLKDRYTELSHGVNDVGENVSLTADEYEEYLSIINQIKDITPELIGGYTAENKVLEDKNTLIEDSIALLKEQERLEKINMLNEDGEARIKGAVEKAKIQNVRYFSEEEAIRANKKGIITNDELDTFLTYKKTGTGNLEDMNNIYDKLQENASDIRDSVKAAQNDAYKVLKDWASTVEGYEQMSSNQKAFINSLSENTSLRKLEEDSGAAIDEIMNITARLSERDDAGLIIDEIINADKTEMKMDEYEDYVTTRVEELYKILDISKGDYDLTEVLKIDDDIKNVSLLKTELQTMLNVTADEFTKLSNNNSVATLYSLFEIFDKFKDLDSLDSLEEKLGDITNEAGELNSELLDAVASLNNTNDITVFKDVVEHMKSIDNIDFNKYSSDMYKMAAEFTNALSFEDLDYRNLESFLDSLDTSLSNFFEKQFEYIDIEVDKLYEMIDSFNEFTELEANIASMDKTSKEYYDTMWDLAMKYPELVKGVNESTGAFELQDGAMTTIKNNMEENISVQQKFIIALLNGANSVATYAETALVNIKNVLTGIDNAGTGMKQFAVNVLNSIGSFFQGSGIFKTLTQKVGEWFKGAASSVKNIDFGDTDGAVNKINGLLSSIDTIQGKIEAYKNVAGKVTAFKGSYSTSKSGSGSNKSNSSSSSDKYKAEVDQYHKYTQALNNVREALEENEILEDLMTDSIEDQIKLLSERNGLLEMEAKAIENLMVAKKKELNDKVWELNQYGYDVKWNREQNTILINNYNKLKTVTGETAKKHEEMLKSIVELNDEIRDYTQAIDENTVAIYKNNYAIQEQKWEEEIARKKKAYEQEIKELENYQDSIETLIDLSVEMMKKEYEAERDEISKVTESYKELLDAKKKALDDEAAQEDYEVELAKKQKEVADLQNKIKEISNDTSAQSVAQRLTLEEELAEKQRELYVFQRDHNIEKSKEALDEEFSNFEEMQNEKLDSIEDYLDQDGALREEAMKQIASQNSDFYNRLIEHNRLYGDGIEETVTRAWNAAGNALDEFGINSMNTLSILVDIADEMERIEAAADALSEEKFVYNDKETYGTTDATNNAGAGLSERGKQQKNQQKYLHNLMVKAIAENNTGLITWIKANRKEWGLDPDTGAIIEQFHTGGFVGDKVLLKSNERFAKLLEGELVVTPQQMDSFINQIWPGIMERSNGYQVTIDNLINVEGNVDKTTIPAIQSASDNAVERLNEYMIKSGYSRNAKKTVV